MGADEPALHQAARNLDMVTSKASFPSRWPFLCVASSSLDAVVYACSDSSNMKRSTSTKQTPSGGSPPTRARAHARTHTRTHGEASIGAAGA
jgi:hypothetical protein